MRDVRALQEELESTGMALVASLDATNVSQSSLDTAYAQHAALVVHSFQGLIPKLLQRYADGWLDDEVAVGYPAWWLEEVGFRNGPPPAETSQARVSQGS